MLQSFFDILQISGWGQVPWVLLDMAIVYYIIYRILLLIRGTRAAQIVLGLIFVIIFFFISAPSFMDLRITNWFLDKFIANFIIIVVIIFQSDIRRALAQAGNQTRFFSTASALQENSDLEEVLKAASLLSKAGCGALIAIERTANLTSISEDGIQLDATISKDLLYSIFLPEYQNPLHDGSVVIQNGRIMAAGCKLSLTNNPRVDKTLGTRHRAGIGLSEETDAAVVIVSEETSNISIAYKGELYQSLEPTEIRDLLQKIFQTGAATSMHESSLKDWWRRLRPGAKTLVENSTIDNDLED